MDEALLVESSYIIPNIACIPRIPVQVEPGQNIITSTNSLLNIFAFSYVLVNLWYSIEIDIINTRSKTISFASFAVIWWVPLKNHIFFPSGEVSTFNITITTNIYSHTCIYFIFGLSWLLGNTYTTLKSLKPKKYCTYMSQ